MNRRTLMLGLLAWPTGVSAEQQPWQARLLQGGFDGSFWWAGLQIQLLPHWKTYWRVPGSGGIAPEISVTGENLRDQTVYYPMPVRLTAGDDDVIGYQDEVVFPLRLTPSDINKSLPIALKAFLGVCDQVCIPAKLVLDGTFTPGGQPSEDAEIVAKWLAKTPKSTSGLVKDARTQIAPDGKTMLALTFSQTVQDVFIEGSPLHYYHPPVFKGNEATCRISGAKSPDELKGTTLRLTMTTEKGGLEETVTVV